MHDGDVHSHFRRGGEVDWARLEREQRARLAFADAWWELLGRPTGARLADVGCGPGVLAARYAELGADVLAVDLRADALARVPRRARVRTLAHDLEAAPLPERVDVVVLSDVLHHARQPLAALRHARASAPRVLVAEPAPGAHAGPPAHARFAPEDVARLLERAGFAAGPVAWPSPGHYALVGTAR